MISNSPSTSPSADRTFAAQPPQSSPDTANLISSVGGAQPMNNITTVSNNKTDEKRRTDIETPPLSTDRGGDDRSLPRRTARGTQQWTRDFTIGSDTIGR